VDERKPLLGGGLGGGGGGKAAGKDKLGDDKPTSFDPKVGQCRLTLSNLA
jgi:hypothetical protein